MPADPSLVKLVPTDLRAACVGKDLSDADPEIDCSDGTIDLYLARWPSAKAARAALQADIADGECDLLHLVDGTILSGDKAVGRAWGCSDEPTLEFTNEPGAIQGSVTIPAMNLFDIEQWVRAQHPGFSGTPKLGGPAFGPPIGSLPLKALIARARTVPYKTLARHIEDYADTLVHYRAKVLQVTDDGALVLVTHDGSGWHDIVFITYTLLDRLLADDTVEFVGRGAGEYDYITVAGDKRSVPHLDVIAIAVR